MDNSKMTPGMSRLMSIIGVISTVIVAAFWLRSGLIGSASHRMLYMRFVPFVLGYIWAIWKFVRAARFPEKYATGSGPSTFLFLVFISIGTPVASSEYLIMSWLALFFLIMVILMERFEDRIRSAVEARRNVN